MPKVTVNYDMSELINDLPQGSNVSKSRIQVYGKDTKLGTTKIVDTSTPVGGFNIDVDRFPLLMEAELTVNTPEGQVELSRKIPVTSAQSVPKTPVIMDVKSYSQQDFSGRFTQKQYNEQVSLAICTLRQKLDHLRDIHISDYPNLKFPSKDLNTILQTLALNVNQLIHRVDNIREEPVMFIDCDDDCAERAYETSIQTALTKAQQLACQLNARVNTLEGQVQILNQIIQNCCMSSGNIGGGSGSTGGGFIGGTGGSPCGPDTPCPDNEDKNPPVL